MKRLLVVMLLMQASGVRADVFTWTDARGIAHYANKEYDIPERYRTKAKPLHLEAEPGSASTSQQGTPSQPQGAPSAPQAAPLPPPPIPPPVPPPVVRAPVSPEQAGEKASTPNRRRRHSGSEQGTGN